MYTHSIMCLSIPALELACIYLSMHIFCAPSVATDVPPEKGATLRQNTGTLDSGSPVETLWRRRGHTHRHDRLRQFHSTLKLESRTNISHALKIHTLSILAFLGETSQGNVGMNWRKRTRLSVTRTHTHHTQCVCVRRGLKFFPMKTKLQKHVAKVIHLSINRPEECVQCHSQNTYTT